MIRAILARDDSWGIGKGNTLPWPHNKEDLQWFKDCTINESVLMGRNTWESLPKKPLSNRKNIVLTSKPLDGECITISKLSELYNIADKNVWIIGGAELIKSAMYCIEEIWLNHIPGDYDCDVFLDKGEILDKFEPHRTIKNGHINATIYRRRN